MFGARHNAIGKVGLRKIEPKLGRRKPLFQGIENGFFFCARDRLAAIAFLVLFFAPHATGSPEAQDQQDQQPSHPQDNHDEWPGPPERRKDPDRDFQELGIPDPVVVRPPDSERVGP